MERTPVLRRALAVAATALLTAGLTACGSTDSWVDSSAARGWPAQYADAANSSFTPTGGAADLTLQ